MECFFHAIAILALCTAASECRQGFYPNVPLQYSTEILDFTQPGNLFIYNWPVQNQTLCPGTVTALDYCYQISTTNGRNTGDRTIFTLLLLDSTYGIIQTISVSNTTTPANCPNRGGIITCCNRQQLRQEQQFQVPGSPVTAFGIFSQTGVDTILAFRNDSSTVRSVTGYQLVADAVIDNINNQINVSPNEDREIQYRMFNFVIDNSPVTLDLTGAGGIDSILRTTGPTRSTESTTKIPDNNSNTKDSPETISETSPTTEGAVSITLIIEIVVGCIVVMLFTVTIAIWAYLCFKTRAMQQRKSKMETNIATVTVENTRNSQMIYESIREGTDVNVNGPHYNVLVWSSTNEQQEQRISTPSNIRHNTTEVPEFVPNPVRSLSLLHTGQLDIAVNMEPNPAYCISQERLFSD